MSKKNKKFDSLRFEIEKDQYLITLAVVIGSLGDVLENEGSKRSNIEVLARIREELTYLQEHYKIIGRDKVKK